jgi:hypothetical protein
MINSRHEYLQPGDLSRLAKMTETQEVAQYFGKDCAVMSVEGKAGEEFMVSGVLQSGIMEGGQKYNLRVKLVDVSIGSGSISAWQLEELTVQGLNISPELIAPVYIPRRYIKPIDDSSLSTIGNYADNIYAFAHTRTRQIFMPGFSSIDNLGALIHENAHVKAEQFYTPQEIDQMEKFYGLMHQIEESKDPVQAARTLKRMPLRRGILTILKLGPRIHSFLKGWPMMRW